MRCQQPWVDSARRQHAQLICDRVQLSLQHNDGSNMQTHLVLNAPSPSVASFGLSIKLLSQFLFCFFLLECPWQIGMLERNTYVIIPHDTEFYSSVSGDAFILRQGIFCGKMEEEEILKCVWCDVRLSIHQHKHASFFLFFRRVDVLNVTCYGS